MAKKIMAYIGALAICTMLGCTPPPPRETFLYATIDPSTVVWFYARSTPTPQPLSFPSQPSMATIKPQDSDPTLRHTVHEAIRLQQRYERIKEQGATDAQLDEIRQRIRDIESLYTTVFADDILRAKRLRKLRRTSKPKTAPKPKSAPQSQPTTAPSENDNCQGCCSYHEGVTCRDGITMCVDGTPLSAACKNKGCEVCAESP